MSNLRPHPSNRGRHDRDALGERSGTPGLEATGDPMHDPSIAPVLRALTAEPGEHELNGLASALTAFRAAHVASPSPHSRRRPSMLSALAGAKLGATIAGLAVGLGGVATVAYVSANVATTPDVHSTAAPTQVPTTHATEASAAAPATASASPVGPDASGSAAYGLCTAWKGVADAGKAMDSVAFKNLTEAAGGADKVEAYCAAVEAPGKSADHPTAKPTTVPSGKPDSVPTSKPTSVPTGKPTTVPTAPTTEAPTTHPTGRP